MRYSIYRELRRQQKLLLKQKRVAEKYLARWGKDGSLETRARNEALLTEARVRLAEIEPRLLQSWEGE